MIGKYKTKDGKSVWHFRYVDMGDFYEIDIMKYPDYGMQSDGAVIAHWLPSNRWDAERMMCFNVGKEPTTLQRAKDYSVQYAELSWEYIKTGNTIDNQLNNRMN